MARYDVEHVPVNRRGVTGLDGPVKRIGRAIGKEIAGFDTRWTLQVPRIQPDDLLVVLVEQSRVVRIVLTKAAGVTATEKITQSAFGSARRVKPITSLVGRERTRKRTGTWSGATRPVTPTPEL